MARIRELAGSPPPEQLAEATSADSRKRIQRNDEDLAALKRLCKSREEDQAAALEQQRLAEESLPGEALERQLQKEAVEHREGLQKQQTTAAGDAKVAKQKLAIKGITPRIFLGIDANTSAMPSSSSSFGPA